MGTNYYRKSLQTAETVQRVAQLVREGKYDECCVDRNKINAIDFIKEFSDGVHLCKISYGWQVCFDHNWGKYYMPTRRDLTAFLSEPGTGIFDEYGAEYTLEQFWNEVDGHNANERSIYTSERYEKEHPNEYHLDRLEEVQKCRELFGVEPSHSEFVSDDGIRFATYSEFC